MQILLDPAKPKSNFNHHNRCCYCFCCCHYHHNCHIAVILLSKNNKNKTCWFSWFLYWHNPPSSQPGSQLAIACCRLPEQLVLLNQKPNPPLPTIISTKMSKLIGYFCNTRQSARHHNHKSISIKYSKFLKLVQIYEDMIVLFWIAFVIRVFVVVVLWQNYKLDKR